MFSLISNRAWKRNMVKMNACPRSAKRNASHILSLIESLAPNETGTVSRVYKRPYIGMLNGQMTMFRATADSIPDEYNAVIGPFKTTRGAQYMIDHNVSSVALAERLAVQKENI